MIAHMVIDVAVVLGHSDCRMFLPMHPMTDRLSFTRDTRPGLILYLLLFTALYGISAPVSAEIDVGCELAFLSKRTLRDWGVGQPEIDHWLSRPDSAFVLRAAAALEASLREPPKEAMEILSVLAYVRLGDKASEGSLLKHFERWPGVSDMEVILGVPLKDLGTPLTNLYHAGRYAKGKDARAWLQKLLDSPVAMMFVARAMLRAAPPDRSRMAALNDSSDGKPTDVQLTAERILQMRMTGTGDYVLWDLVRSTPKMAWIFSTIMFNTGFNLEKDNRWMMENRTGLIEWTAKKLRGLDAGPPLREEWGSYYSWLTKLAKQPLMRWPKFPFSRVRDYTMGDGTFIEQVKRGALIVEVDLEGDFIRQMLLDGPKQGAFLRTDAVLIARMMLILAGVRLPSLNELRGGIRRSTAEGIAALTSLVPMRAGDEVSASVGAESEPFSFRGAGARDQEMALSLGTDEQPFADDAYWERSHLINYVERRISVSELEPDTEYDFTFKMPHHKFVGEQRVSFGKRVLKEFRAYEAPGVDAVKWLTALSAGIAPRDGRKGIKPLSNLESDDLAFEIKLVGTVYRLLGHWRKGVWYVESMDNTH